MAELHEEKVITRFNPSKEMGLCADQVNERIADKLV